jgi:hypothetical protein
VTQRAQPAPRLPALQPEAGRGESALQVLHSERATSSPALLGRPEVGQVASPAIDPGVTICSSSTAENPNRVPATHHVSWQSGIDLGDLPEIGNLGGKGIVSVDDFEATCIKCCLPCLICCDECCG